MDRLNFHHLYYFWTVSRLGSVAAASDELRLASSTISAQIKRLEEQLGHPLLRRAGRGVVLTDAGRVAQGYAEDIFLLGRELQTRIKLQSPGRTLRLRVGIAHVVPKLISRRILEAATALSQPVQLICREDRPENLLAELALHHLDLVLSDAPRPTNVGVQAYNHFLGESAVQVFGAPALVKRFPGPFPQALARAPFLLPTHDAAIRRALDHWFEVHDITPIIAGEFDDSALMKSFGEAGHGFFPAPEVVADEVALQYNLTCVGTATGVRDRFYAISEERRLRHPAVVALAEGAQIDVFGQREAPAADS